MARNGKKADPSSEASEDESEEKGAITPDGPIMKESSDLHKAMLDRWQRDFFLHGYRQVPRSLGWSHVEGTLPLGSVPFSMPGGMIHDSRYLGDRKTTKSRYPLSQDRSGISFLVGRGLLRST